MVAFWMDGGGLGGWWRFGWMMVVWLDGGGGGLAGWWRFFLGGDGDGTGWMVVVWMGGGGTISPTPAAATP